MNCTDCMFWNPDAPQSNYCDQDDDPDVAAFWDENGEALFLGDRPCFDATDCPGFKPENQIDAA